jgi:hypothetical protein
MLMATIRTVMVDGKPNLRREFGRLIGLSSWKVDNLRVDLTG